jgi:hypothetical protein
MYQLSFDHRHSYNPTGSGIEVPVSLSVLGQTFDVVTKVDTGATSCIFAREVGYELGLDIESGRVERFSVPNGGSFTAYGHSLQIRCLGVQIDALVYFAADPAFRRNVLGRRGWLEHVRVAFVDYERSLFLAPYNPS